MKRGLLLFAAGSAAFAIGTIAYIAGWVLLIRHFSPGLAERLGNVPATVAGKVAEHVPHNVTMPGVSRLQEQNEEIISLLRDRLGGQEAPAAQPAAPEGGDRKDG